MSYRATKTKGAIKSYPTACTASEVNSVSDIPQKSHQFLATLPAYFYVS